MAAPTAAFAYATPNWGPSPLSVTLQDLSSSSPTSWLWKFDNGDGTAATSTQQNPTHLFTGPPYLWRYVELTVANADGSSTVRQGPFPGGVYLNQPNI